MLASIVPFDVIKSLSVSIAVVALSGTSYGHDVSWQELQAAREQWINELVVKSTFQYREGFSTSEATAKQGEPFAGVSKTAKGVFHKRGTLVRHSVIYDHAPSIVGAVDDNLDVKKLPNDPMAAVKSGERVVVADASEDSVYDDERILAYSIGWGNYFDRATFTRRVDLHVEPGRRSCVTAENWTSPINPVPGCYLGLPGSMQGSFAATEFTVTALQNGNLALVGESTVDKAGLNRITIEWSTQWDLPTIVRCTRELIVDGKRTSYAESLLSDFRESGGVHVASHIRFIAGQGSEGAVMVRDWISEDMGKELPTDDDFVIEIPSTTVVVGLDKSDPPGTVRRLNLAGTPLTRFMSAAKPETLSNPVSFEVPPRGKSIKMWLIVANVSFVAFLIALLWWRLSQRKK